MKTLITGATGNVGARVVRALAERGVPTRAFVHDRDKAASTLGDADVELAVGDFADGASVRAALRGVDAVFLTSADGPDKVANETAVVDAAVAEGVARIVKLSVNGASADSPVTIWRWHAEIEAHLGAARVAGTVLSANFFMTNLLAMAGAVRQTGLLFLPLGEASIAMIDPEDVAAAAAAVLADDRHNDSAYVLTGPSPLTGADVAEQLSAATGRSIGYVAVPDDQAHAGLVQAGAPDWLAAEMVTMFGELRRGIASSTTDTVERLIGRAPRSLSSFAGDVAGLFGPEPVPVPAGHPPT
jgi:uncharacterized protein YbjT (DUF2867 family)